MITLLGIYRPRDTPLHNSSAAFKMALLLVTSIAAILTNDPVSAVGIAAACLLLLASTTPPARATFRGMAGIAIIAAATSGYQMWQGEYFRAIDTSADIIAIAALALAVTSSTPMEEVLDLVSTLARPLRRVLPPETIGLMFSMMLRAIPEAAQILNEARTAARARGLERSPRAILIPSATRTVGFAINMGQALHARGIADEAAPRAL